MITLGIETSCDETACAIINNGRVLSNVVSSSMHLHKKYGGVIPEIASRCHIEYINAVLKNAIKKANVKLKDIDLVAVTNGPGLAGSLLVGISFAKALGYALNIPVIGIDHLKAHPYANFIKGAVKGNPGYPFIGLVVSGGHTSIFLCRNVGDFRFLGNTQDDAAGEAFDKVAKIMDLGYPGGPIIEKKAERAGKAGNVNFPRTYLEKGSLDFSFSGVKTAVLYFSKSKDYTHKAIPVVCSSFQEAVFDVIVDKSLEACRKHRINMLLVGGGVASNKRFRKKINEKALHRGVSVFVPKKCYCLDNAAMVGVLGEALYGSGKRPAPDLADTIRLRSKPEHRKISSDFLTAINQRR